MKGIVDHYIVSMKKVEKQIRKDRLKKIQQDLDDIEGLTFEEAVAYFEFADKYKKVLDIE